MSTPSELSKTQLETLRAQLLAAREQIVGRARMAAPVSARQPDVGDDMDAADRTSEREETGARNERERARLAEIDRALAKFDRDEYGISEDSGEPIGYGRLHALPWARLTVAEEEALAKRR
ncbi:MAG: TraR/DksA family transcriptional regulator [Polyangiaceae bacterium]|jgi:DnaK suppressor protein